MGDLKSFQARYSALRQRMILDGLQLGLPIHPNDLPIIVERLQSEGTSFAKVTLPLLGKALDQGLVSGHFMCTAHFRLKRNTRLPNLFYSCFARVFNDDGTIKLEPCVDSIRFLRLILLFDSKLVFEPGPVMKDEAVTEFGNRMSALRKVSIPLDHPVLLRAQMLLGRVLANLDLSDIHPGHGPGAVAERLDRFGRWDFHSWPLRAERSYPYLMYGTHSIRALLERKKGIHMTRESHTRCCLVPKDFKGPRLISAEGFVNQYLQQGQMRAIMDYVSMHPILKRSIKLQDQTYNQKAAQISYATDTCTLDLSNASDTVSTTLVWYLLKRVPELRRYLMATRSDYMIYSGKKIKIVAFAPMGSATCFPVETLVFWSLAMASMKLASIHNGGDAISDSEAADSIRVFGDDIIIPRHALDTLIGTLSRVGCSVNMSKTCYQTPFRESCGSEWFNGLDISIIRNKKFNYEQLNVKDHPVLCDLQRKLFLNGWHNSAVLLSEWAREILPTPTTGLHKFLSTELIDSLGFRLSGCGSSLIALYASKLLSFFDKQSLPIDRYHGLLGFCDDFPNHPRARIRFNEDYQRLEYKTPVVFQNHKSWSTGGYPRLLARLLCDQSDRIAIRDRKIKMAWSILPFFIPFRMLD